jgi:phosphopantetheinyl transferase (holo-ACP synthase)
MKTTFRSFDLRRSKAGQPKLHLLGQTISDKNKDKQASGLGDFEAGEVDLLASLSHDVGVVVGVVIAQRQRK